MANHPFTIGAEAEHLARSHRPAAFDRGQAVVVGNRAGIVEWADETFARLTGFPLRETLEKPITHFLNRAGVEVDLVEFVAQQFLEGRSTTVELPFETFDGRSIKVHLEVEPLRDEGGEIVRFIAVASDITARPKGFSPAVAAPTATSPIGRSLFSADESRSRLWGPLVGRAPRTDSAEPVALDRLVAAAGRRHAPQDASEVILEIILESRLPRVRTNPMQLNSLLDCLFECGLIESDGRPTFITALAGRLAKGRSHLSQVHPIPARGIPRAAQESVYLEVHDSGPHLAGDLRDRFLSGETGRTPRERALGRAGSIAAELGLPLYFNSTPGCGTQVLILLPPANPTSLRFRGVPAFEAGADARES